MSLDPEVRDTLEDLARDLDMLVWKLEQPPSEIASVARRERDSLRRELEQARDRLTHTARR